MVMKCITYLGRELSNAPCPVIFFDASGYNESTVKTGGIFAAVVHRSCAIPKRNGSL